MMFRIVVWDVLPCKILVDRRFRGAYCVLRLGQDEVPVRETPTPSVSKRTRPTEDRRNGRPVCWQCGRAGHLWRECPRGPAKETVDKSD
jgi:hypothetical protein